MLLSPDWESFLEKKSLKKTLKISVTKQFEESPIIYCFKNLPLMIIAGFSDCSFLFFKENKQIDLNIMIFHKKPISCLCVVEEKGILICGSRDCLLSLWKFQWESDLKLIVSPLEKSSYTLYGHQEEVLMLNYSKNTDILLSIDKEGACLLFNLSRKRLMKRIELRGERLQNAIIHDYGIIAAFSKKRAFLLK